MNLKPIYFVKLLSSFYVCCLFWFCNVGCSVLVVDVCFGCLHHFFSHWTFQTIKFFSYQFNSVQFSLLPLNQWNIEENIKRNNKEADYFLMSSFQSLKSSSLLWMYFSNQACCWSWRDAFTHSRVTTSIQCQRGRCFAQ